MKALMILLLAAASLAIGACANGNSGSMPGMSDEEHRKMMGSGKPPTAR